MPRRILADDFGEDLLEQNLSDLALMAYTFIGRALCYYGGCKYNLVVIHVAAFKGRVTPCIDDVKRALKEYEQCGLVERWKDDNGEYIWFTRWFRDNSFRFKTKPSIPRPPSLNRKITQSDWESGNSKALQKLVASCNPFVAKEVQEGEVKEEVEVEVKEVYVYFKEQIQPDTQIRQPSAKAVKIIKTRLKQFSLEDLKKAIDTRVKDNWFMKKNAWRTAAWFFGDQDRVETYINAKPEGAKNKRAEIDEE